MPAAEPADFLGLTGRTILVTGASSGIGRQTAISASRQGARVVCVGRRAMELEEVVAGLDGDGHLAVPFDVTDLIAIPAMFRSVVDQVGPLHGLVHAAGVHATGPLRSLDPANVARQLEINVTATIMLARGFRHRQVRADDASVVLMSSAVGLVGEAGVSVYAATKAAVASLAKSWGLELARESIRVNAIAAGVVRTPLTDGIRSSVGDAAWAAIEAAHPLGLGTVDDVADAALFLLSPVARWVTGSVLVVDGGYTAR